MFDSIRTLLHKAITTKAGDSLAPIRLPKQMAKGLNELLGEPLCSPEELEKRRVDEKARVERILNPTGTTTRAPAPVVVYFEKDRNARELVKVKEVLGGRNITPTLLDVSGDEATISFVMLEAKCERDELPVVFVGGVAVGGFRELVAFDTSGQLKKAVFGG
jgi:glutaredoxin